MRARLPVDACLPELLGALADGPCAVLEAPPGAGKTTRVPPALLGAGWRGDGRIVMLEPRRIAARMAARRMAAELGEAVGGLVGYRVRDDVVVSGATRIEVVTEGIVTRMLQSDPGLDGVAALVFDEFHERSLDADLALALALEAQGAFRPDLRIIVMSATLDGARVASLLGDAPVIRAEGRVYPVETRWLGRPGPGQRIEDAVAAAVRDAVAETDGGVLVFLPGGGEIRRTAARLDGRLPAHVDVRALYGDLPPAAQDAAVAPAGAGRRKVVLATAIAETSLTIEDARVVIDAGLARGPRFDPGSGMTRLVTTRVSRAAADQRRGRAGRVAPGVCWRLWSEAEHGGLPEFAAPEIAQADLAGFALDLAAWGVAADALALMDAPPPGALAQARDVLTRLGALDGEGRITPHGRVLARAPLHPRLAHMVVAESAEGRGGLACEIAALVEGRDPSDSRDADIAPRIALLRAGRGRWAPLRDAARHLKRRLRAKGEGAPENAGLAIARAWPDRVALRRAGDGPRFALAVGRGARLDETDPLAGEAMLAVATLDGAGPDARIRLAAPLDPEAFAAAFADDIAESDRIGWDPRSESVIARTEHRFGALALSSKPLRNPDPEAVAAAMVEGVARIGVAALPWPDAASSLRTRVNFLAREMPDAGWPDLSDAALVETLGAWLAPFLPGVMRRADLGRVDLAGALRALLPWELARDLDQLAPTHLALPSGAGAAIDYAAEGGPRAGGRIQQFFGCAEHPTVAGGRVPVVLELMSPAGRPQQVTSDLPGFWRTSYAAVRADLRGRYPRHPWPEDPLSAEATNLAKPRR